MALTIDYATRVISVPQADLTFISGTLYELDTNQFKKDVMAILDDQTHIWMPDAFIHNTEVTVAGTTFARTIEFINSYSVTFEDTGGQYSVRLVGSNNNIFDVENGILNPTDKVTVISTNSAGLISSPKIDEVHTRLGLELGNPITDTTTGIDSADGSIDIDRTGDGVTTSTLTRQ